MCSVKSCLSILLLHHNLYAFNFHIEISSAVSFYNEKDNAFPRRCETSEMLCTFLVCSGQKVLVLFRQLKKNIWANQRFLAFLLTMSKSSFRVQNPSHTKATMAVVESDAAVRNVALSSDTSSNVWNQHVSFHWIAKSRWLRLVSQSNYYAHPWAQPECRYWK